MTEPLDDLSSVRAVDAAAAGPVMAAAALDGVSAAGAFRAAHQLRAASAAAGAAAREEAGAEAAAEAMAARFRAAQGALVQAAEAARQSADVGAAVSRGLAGWLDPYATDAAGSRALDTWRATLDGLPRAVQPALAPLRSAMATARAAGADWDVAEQRRAAAIAARVVAMARWRAAVAALLAAAGPGPWLDAAPAAPPPDDERDWFVE